LWCLRYPLNSARTFRRPSFQRTQLGAANHSAYSTRRDQIQRLHISATFISENTTLRFQTPGLLKSSKYTRYKTTNNGYDVYMSREMHYKTFHQIYETNYVTKSLYRNIKFYTLKNLTITLSLNISRLYVYKVSK